VKKDTQQKLLKIAEILVIQNNT